MNEVNRSVFVVRAKEPFLQWLNSLPDPGDFTLDEVNRDSTAYLLPEFEDDDEMEKLLGEILREYLRNPEFAKMLDNMFERLKAPTGPVRFAEGALPKEIAEKGLAKLESTLYLRKCAPLLAQKDILLIGGWDDNLGSIENNVLPLYRALKKANAQDVKILAFQDNHAFSDVRTELANVIIEWIQAVYAKNKK